MFEAWVTKRKINTVLKHLKYEKSKYSSLYGKLCNNLACNAFETVIGLPVSEVDGSFDLPENITETEWLTGSRQQLEFRRRKCFSKMNELSKEIDTWVKYRDNPDWMKALLDTEGDRS